MRDHLGLNIGLGWLLSAKYIICKQEIIPGVFQHDCWLLGPGPLPGLGDSVISKIIIKTVSAVTRDPPPPSPLTVATV